MGKPFSQRVKSFIIFIVLLSMSVSTWADIRINQLKFDRKGQDARRHPVLDEKGHQCALIKVKFSESSLGVDALQERNYKLKGHKQTLYLVEPACESHPDEVWIYLSADTKRFRLSHPKYGNLAEEGSVKNGFYYLDYKLAEGTDYILEIQCTEPKFEYSTPPTSKLPQLSEITISDSVHRTKFWLDGSRVKPGETYRAPIGGHIITAARPFCRTVKEKFTTAPRESIKVGPVPTALPIYCFGGLEIGKPSSYSDLAYGIRLGAVIRWGIYASLMTTIGTNASGDDIDYNEFPKMYENPYNSPHYSYFSWHAGILYRCFSPMHIYAGVGTAQSNVVWESKDDKLHANLADEISGITWEAGGLYNLKRVYVSGGVEGVNGRCCGKIGLGVYLNVK